MKAILSHFDFIFHFTFLRYSCLLSICLPLIEMERLPATVTSSIQTKRGKTQEEMFCWDIFCLNAPISQLCPEMTLITTMQRSMELPSLQLLTFVCFSKTSLLAFMHYVNTKFKCMDKILKQRVILLPFLVIK